MSKSRKSGIELLRVISMFLLVWVHDNTHKFSNTFSQFEYILKDFIPILMVNIFIMISSLHSDKLKGRWKPALKKIFTYYIIVFIIKNTIIAINDGITDRDIIDILKDPIGVIQSMPWFIKGYVISLIAIQFYNPNIKIKTSLTLFTLLLVIPFTVWWFNILNLEVFNIKAINGDLLQLNWGLTIPSYNWMLIYGLIIICRPLLQITSKLNIKKIVIILSSIVIVKLSLDFLSISLFNQAYNHRGYNTLFNVLMPIFIVSLFHNIDISSRKINKLGSFTLLVYLLESGSGLGHLIRDNMFTGTNTINYIMSFTSRFVILFAIAYIINETIEYTKDKIKNRP